MLCLEERLEKNASASERIEPPTPALHTLQPITSYQLVFQPQSALAILPTSGITLRHNGGRNHASQRKSSQSTATQALANPLHLPRGPDNCPHKPASPPLPLPPPFIPSSPSPSPSNPNPIRSVLSTTAGLDTTLLTLNYTLVLLYAQLDALSTRRLSSAASALATKATTTLLPGETLIATLAPAPSSRLLRSSRALRALADLVADVRVFLRLWGLLGIWAWAASVWRTPPADGVLRRLAWAQVGVNVGYQVLENGAYLGQHGVVRVSEARRARWWVWSSRFWMAHVLLDLGRLARVRALRGIGEGVEKEGKVRKEREEESWWREVYVNAAYAPLTVHWSLEQGCVSEAWVGFLGMVAGAVGLKELWEETA